MLFLYLETLTEEDQNRFWNIWEKNQKNLLAYVQCKLYGVQTYKSAEDVVSDSFLALMTHYERYYELPDEKIKFLLIKICENNIKNIVIRSQKVSMDSLTYDNDDDGEFTEIEISDGSQNPEELTISEDTVAKIERIVISLDAKYRDVLQLKLFVGLGDDLIAEALKITKENVRQRYRRGRKMIIKELGGEK